MRKALSLFILLSLPASVSATWALVPLEKLVQESDIIVVGTLRGVSEHSYDEVDYGEGRIEVREVIWGSVAPGDSLLLKWSNPSGVACPRVEHKGNEGEEGVWLLMRDGEAVRADYPGRFVELSERRRVVAALERYPVVLRSAGYWVGVGEPMRFAVVYRNVSGMPREFPGFAFEGGRPLLAAGSRLTGEVTGVGDPRPLRLTGRFASDSRLQPVTLAPGEERRVEFDLRGLLASEPLKGEFYAVTLKLPGRPPTNEAEFYIGGPEIPRSNKASTPAPEKEVYVFTAPQPRRGLAPLTRAGLTALAALLLFPLFRRLRSAFVAARLARAANGVQTWQT